MDDGIDPRYYFRPEKGKEGGERKTLQLCAQVAHAVGWALSGLLDDERLQVLVVERVEKAPDARRLRVVLQVPLQEADAVAELQRRVARALPRIRAVVAEIIHRRRTPDLVIQVQVQVEDEGEED